MSDLHREMTSLVTQEYTRTLEEAPLQSGAHLAASQGWVPTCQGGRLAISTNGEQPHGSCRHRL